MQKNKQTDFKHVIQNDLILPHDLQVERLVLGQMLSGRPTETAEILAILKSTDIFFNPAHRTLYDAIKTLYIKSQPADLITVTYLLRETGKLEEAGGVGYIAEVSQQHTFHYLEHCAVLLDLYSKRTLMQATARAQAQILDNEPLTGIFTDMQMALIEAQEPAGKKSMYDGSMVLEAVTANMVEIAKYGLDGDGTRIRLNELRSILGCWHRGDLVIIAGRPAMGKTSFVESILSDFAISGKAGIFLSLEMTALQVGYRLLSGLSVTDSRKYSAAELKTSAMYPTEEVATVVVPELQKRFKNRYSNNAGSLLFIDDQSNMNIAQIRAKVMQLIAGSRNPVGGVVIDYLGLIDDTTPTNKGDNKVNRIADITRALKCMAKEFAIPVILLCQLSRAVETRQDKRPILADLRDSGAIEQDADVVLFLHRPEYYRDCEEFVEHHTEGTQVSKEGYGEIIVAKNRNGGLGIAPFRFIAHCTAMVDYSEQPTAAPANYYEVEQVPF